MKSHVRCDALILDEESRSDTYPYMEIEEKDARIGHEATVSKVGDDQLFYLRSRGLTEQQATAMIVNGFIEPIVEDAADGVRGRAVAPDRAQHGRRGRLDRPLHTMTTRSQPTPRARSAGPTGSSQRRLARGRAARRRSPGRPPSEEIWRYSRIDELDLDRYRPFADRGARRARRRARAGRRAVGRGGRASTRA